MDGAEYWDIVLLVKHNNDVHAVVREYVVHQLSHPILHCPYIERGKSLHLVLLDSATISKLSFAPLVPDFAVGHDKGFYFYNKFLVEQFRKINIVS